MSIAKPSRPASTIMLPVERVAQLRALAAADSTTITETIERLINEQIAAGRLPDTLPGYDVIAAVSRVFLSVHDFTFPAMSPRQARQIAELLEEFGTGKEGGKKARFSTGAEEIRFRISRKGRGVTIGGEDIQTARTVKATMTAGMARDLARIIRTEAAKVSKH
jgi:hypothetical protein